MQPSFIFLSHDNKIGDAIVLTGLLGPIKRRWPQAKMGVVCGPTNAVVYQNHPLVDRMHTASSRNFLSRAWAGLSARRGAYQHLVHFGSDVDSRSLRTLVRAIRAEDCTLFFPPQRALASKQRVLQGDWLHCHTAQRHQSYLDSLGIATADYAYDLHLASDATLQARNWMAPARSAVAGPHITIACDASTTNRSFEVAWLEQVCAAMLTMQPQACITLLCASLERHQGLQEMALTCCAQTKRSDAVRVAPLSADAGLAMALIAQSGVLLSPDTFAVHAASAFKVPVVAVYPGDAHTLVTWAPRSPLYLQLVAPPGQGLAAHKPEFVASQCTQLLSQAPGVTSATP